MRAFLFILFFFSLKDSFASLSCSELFTFDKQQIEEALIRKNYLEEPQLKPLLDELREMGVQILFQDTTLTGITDLKYTVSVGVQSSYENYQFNPARTTIKLPIQIEHLDPKNPTFNAQSILNRIKRVFDLQQQGLAFSRNSFDMRPSAGVTIIGFNPRVKTTDMTAIAIKRLLSSNDVQSVIFSSDVALWERENIQTHVRYTSFVDSMSYKHLLFRIEFFERVKSWQQAALLFDSLFLPYDQTPIIPTYH